MSKQKLSDLAKKRGIYAVLLLGVFVVIAVVMIMITSNPKESENKNLVDLNEAPQNAAQADPGNNDSTYGEKQTNEELANNPPVVNAEVTPIVSDNTEPDLTAKTTPEPTKEAEQKAEVTKQAEQPQTKPVMQTTAKNLTFDKEAGLAWPVKGDVIMPYSVEKTTYFSTLKQYGVNPAILISGEIGTEVKAAAKGVVTSIENDARTGNTITMDIGSDYKVVYGQMSETKLKTGDVVNAGDVIGTLAKATKFYVIEGSHLYFQVYEGENTIDPMLLLKSE